MKLTPCKVDCTVKVDYLVNGQGICTVKVKGEDIVQDSTGES